MTVTSPNGSEAWVGGQQEALTWSFSGADCGESVKLERLLDGSVCRTIVESAENSGSYTWTVERCGDAVEEHALQVTDLTAEASDGSVGMLAGRQCQRLRANRCIR